MSMTLKQRLLAMSSPLVGFDGPFGPGNTGGYNQRADILVQAADGTDLFEVFQDIQETLALWNSNRDNLISRLTYQVTEPIERVGVATSINFEKASEFGQPRGASGMQYYQRGYDFDFYDLAVRYTWMFLGGANRAQIENLHNQALEADNRLLFSLVMKTLFNPINIVGVADSNIPTQVVKFYNGDGEVPPPFKNITFSGTHTHYSTTQTLASSATLTSATLDKVELDFRQHGNSPQQNGTQLIAIMNNQEAAIVRTFKTASGSKYDFIPNSNVGGGIYLPMNGGIIGQPGGPAVPGSIGTYGPFQIVEEEYIPAGYLAFLASGGSNNFQNPIGIRQHLNPFMQGLRLIPGARSDYPLIDSFYQRGFGSGIRQRGAGFLVQVTNNASYTVPSIYA